MHPSPSPDLAAGTDGVRDATVDAAIEVFRRSAFHEVTVEQVVAEGRLELAAVLGAFPSWYDLVATAVDRWTAERMRAIFPVAEAAGTIAFLRAVLVANAADPALMRLLSAMVSIAGTPDHPLAAHLQQRWLHFYAFVVRSVTADAAAGREVDTLDPGRAAEQLIAVYEGLQIQSMVRPGLNLVEAFDRAAELLRAGWARSGAQLWPV